LLVVALGVARAAEHLDGAGAGLEEGALAVLAVPAGEPWQRQHLAVEAAGAVEVLRPEDHAELTDLHRPLPHAACAQGAHHRGARISRPAHAGPWLQRAARGGGVSSPGAAAP